MLTSFLHSFGKGKQLNRNRINILGITRRFQFAAELAPEISNFLPGIGNQGGIHRKSNIGVVPPLQRIFFERLEGFLNELTLEFPGRWGGEVACHFEGLGRLFPPALAFHHEPQAFEAFHSKAGLHRRNAEPTGDPFGFKFRSWNVEEAQNSKVIPVRDDGKGIEIDWG